MGLFDIFSDYFSGKEVEFLGETYHLIRSSGIKDEESGAEFFLAFNSRAELPAPVVIIPVIITQTKPVEENTG